MFSSRHDSKQPIKERIVCSEVEKSWFEKRNFVKNARRSEHQREEAFFSLTIRKSKQKIFIFGVWESQTSTHGWFVRP